MPSGLVIKPSKLRKVDSNGMICSARELGLPNAPQVRGILVLDKGEIKEFDTPWNLFNTENSIFQQMCHRSNITEQDFQEATGF